MGRASRRKGSTYACCRSPAPPGADACGDSSWRPPKRGDEAPECALDRPCELFIDIVSSPGVDLRCAAPCFPRAWPLLSRTFHVAARNTSFRPVRTSLACVPTWGALGTNPKESLVMCPDYYSLSLEAAIEAPESSGQRTSAGSSSLKVVWLAVITRSRIGWLRAAP